MVFNGEVFVGEYFNLKIILNLNQSSQFYVSSYFNYILLQSKRKVIKNKMDQSIKRKRILNKI